MIRISNECCGCATDSYPCLGESCSNRHVTRMYCDKCGKEVEYLREYDGEQWCDDCILDEFDFVELEED